MTIERRLGPQPQPDHNYDAAITAIKARFLELKRERSMTNMRAKVKVTQVNMSEHSDALTFVPVCKSGSYPPDGMDEDNTFAKFSPSGKFELTVANPALLGKFRPGQTFYVDFTPVEQV